MGVSRIERRDHARLTLLNDAGEVGTFAPDERLPTYWTYCYDAPCTCRVIANEMQCGGPSEGTEEIQDVLAVIERSALLRDGSLVYWTYWTSPGSLRGIVHVLPPPR